jgi:hypothetical protein
MLEYFYVYLRPKIRNCINLYVLQDGRDILEIIHYYIIIIIIN